MVLDEMLDNKCFASTFHSTDDPTSSCITIQPFIQLLLLNSSVLPRLIKKLLLQKGEKQDSGLIREKIWGTNLVQELKVADTKGFKEMLRISYGDFKRILLQIKFQFLKD